MVVIYLQVVWSNPFEGKNCCPIPLNGKVYVCCKDGQFPCLFHHPRFPPCLQIQAARCKDATRIRGKFDMFQLFRMLSFEEDPICCCCFVNHVFVFGTIWDFLRRCGKVVEKTNKHDFENYLVFGKFVSICWVSPTFQTDVQTQFCCNACGEKHTHSVNHNYGLPSPPHFYLFFLEVSTKLLLFAHNRPMWFDVVIVALTLKRLQMQTRMLHQTSQHRHVPPPPPHNHHHHHHHHHHNHHHRRYRHSSSFSSSSSAASSSSSHSKIEALKGNHVSSTWKLCICFAACGKGLPQFTGQAPGNEILCKRQWINMVVHEINYCNPIINRTNQPMVFFVASSLPNGSLTIRMMCTCKWISYLSDNQVYHCYTFW